MGINPTQTATETTVILVKINGVPINDTHSILSIRVHHAINQISTAELVIIGGWDAASGQSNAKNDDFIPGNRVDIFAGYDQTEMSCLFKGEISKQTLRLDASGQSTLTLTCKHEAVVMTYQEKDRYFEKTTDDDIIRNILSEWGLTNQVSNCSTFQESYFQRNTTDWHSILNRSMANGCILTLDNQEGIIVSKPALSGQAPLCIEAGVSMLAFEGTMDAASQPSQVTLSAWDPIHMTTNIAHATEPAMNQQGSYTAKQLSSVINQPAQEVNTDTYPDITALQARADSILLHKRLAAFSGKVTFTGNGLAKTGTLITLKGVGKELSGEAFVSAVTHSLEAGKWETTACFGMEKNLQAHSQQMSTQENYGPIKTGQGLQLGTVRKIDGDADQLFRIQVQLTYGVSAGNYIWARMAHLFASNHFGAFFLPEIGDEVVLGCLENDASYPVILGSLYNGKHSPPYTPEAENNSKAFVTRSKMKIAFDEAKKSISLLTPGNNSIILSDDGKEIEIKDQHNNSLLLGADGITLDSAKDIKISAKGKISIEGIATISVAAKADLTLAGMNVKAEAQVGLTAKGSATAELSAAGQTTVRGSMVMIN